MKLKSLCFCIITLILFSVPFTTLAQNTKSAFKVIAFYTAKHDQAHISFVHEANKWFPKMAAQYHFTYDSTSNWENLNARFLAKYQIVIFLDTRPELPAQREAFETYVNNRGGWMGFHFSAFALTPSDYSQNWDWYHNTFLGSGQYKSNTWRPTSAVLRVEDKHHKSSPNEWYRWEKDIARNPDIDILLAIDPASFPLGTGPKPQEIWHSGYYPVVWTNKKYQMVYFNMGHNDIDYEHGTNKDLSYTFDNDVQNRLIINALLWLGKAHKTRLK
jgi:hypothetical protein